MRPVARVAVRNLNNADATQNKDRERPKVGKSRQGML